MGWNTIGNLKGPAGADGGISTDASDITTGTLAASRLPSVLSAVQTSSGTTLAINASNGNNVNHTATANLAVSVPTNGTDHQVIQVVVLASAAITVTFNGSFARLDGVNASYQVPSGKKMRFALRRSDLGTSGQWIVEAVGITQ